MSLTEQLRFKMPTSLELFNTICFSNRQLAYSRNISLFKMRERYYDELISN